MSKTQIFAFGFLLMMQLITIILCAPFYIPPLATIIVLIMLIICGVGVILNL